MRNVNREEEKNEYNATLFMSIVQLYSDLYRQENETCWHKY